MSRPTGLPQQFYSVQQVADVLHVSTKTVRRLLGQELPFHRVASAIRVSQEDLYAYIRSTRR